MLKRTGALKRTSPLRQRQRCVQTASAVPRQTGPDFWVSEDVKARFFGRCARCGNPGETIQHRKPRRAGGTRRPEINGLANLIWVCGDGVRGCHGHMESQRTEAHRNGWLLHDTEDIELAACLLWDGRWVLLKDDGRVVETTPGEASDG